MHPDALPVVRKMHLAVVPFRIAAARLHRVDDDTVVAHVQTDGFRCGIKCLLRRRLVAHAPVERHVVRRFGVQRLAAPLQRHMGGQIVNVECDQLRRVARLVQCLGNHHRDGLSHEAHAPLGKHRTQGLGPFRAIAVLQHGRRHRDIHPRRFQILDREHRMHALCLGRICDIQRRDHPMCDGRAEEIGMQRVGWRDVIHIAPLAGQKPHILDPFDRLAFPEFFHLAASFDHHLGVAPDLKRQTGDVHTTRGESWGCYAKFSAPQPSPLRPARLDHPKAQSAT